MQVMNHLKIHLTLYVFIIFLRACKSRLISANSKSIFEKIYQKNENVPKRRV